MTDTKKVHASQPL